MLKDLIKESLEIIDHKKNLDDQINLKNEVQIQERDQIEEITIKSKEVNKGFLSTLLGFFCGSTPSLPPKPREDRYGSLEVELANLKYTPDEIYPIVEWVREKAKYYIIAAQAVNQKYVSAEIELPGKPGQGKQLVDVIITDNGKIIISRKDQERIGEGGSKQATLTPKLNFQNKKIEMIGVGLRPKNEKWIKYTTVMDEIEMYKKLNQLANENKIHFKNLAKADGVFELANGDPLIYQKKYDYNLRQIVFDQELLEGIKIENKKGKFEKNIKIFEAIMTGIQLLHSKGIYHADIKLDNILISKDGDVVLGDFGLSDDPRVFIPERSTVDYEAPEMMNIKKIDGAYQSQTPERNVTNDEDVKRILKRDIFSLGIVGLKIFKDEFQTFGKLNKFSLFEYCENENKQRQKYPLEYEACIFHHRWDFANGVLDAKENICLEKGKSSPYCKIATMIHGSVLPDYNDRFSIEDLQKQISDISQRKK